MDIHGNLAFKNGGLLQRARLELASTFPVDPKVGEFLFMNRRVYICVSIEDAPVWVPMTQELDVEKYSQNTPALEWTFNHSLGDALVMVQVFDSTGKVVIPDVIDCSVKNRVFIRFATPQAGFAIAQLGEATGVAKENVAYSATFTNQATWTINHGLGYNPTVQCIVDWYVIQPQSIQHTSAVQTVVTFSTAKSGSVRCV